MDIETAAVIGAGAMGHGIAEVLARQCSTVWLHDSSVEVREAAGGRIAASIARLRRHDLISEETARRIPDRIRVTGDLAQATSSAAFVVEAVSENLPLKQELFGTIDGHSPEDAILATNSSSLRIGDVMAQVSERRRTRLVGSHFFLPAQIVPLVEVSRTADTSADVFDRVVALWEACGKEPIRIERDISGYIANRLQRALMGEALALLAEGTATAEDIDRSVTQGFGLRFMVRGPLAQRDVAGLDLAASMQYDGGGPERLDAGRQHLLELVASGQLGLKTGRGLLDWEGMDPDATVIEGDDALAEAVSRLQRLRAI